MNKFGEYGRYDDDEFENEKSKSEIKRELLALKELAKKLVELPLRDLKKLDLDYDLLDKIVQAKDMTHGALKRQIGFIGARIVHEDYETIQSNLDKLSEVHNGQVKQFHQLEQWRDQLLTNDKQIISVLMNQFSDFDIQYVRQLIRNATKEATEQKPPKSSRLLFKYLQQCQANYQD